MSLSSGRSPALDLAVDGAVRNGVHFAVATGNDNAGACYYSPAVARLMVTVGASTLSDERTHFSNYGKCVDIFASGLEILSTGIGSKNATHEWSGTSMVAAHTACLLRFHPRLNDF
ncbi:hypothetical protein ACGC1H_005162 [Rhizoctonia solani]